MNLIEKNNHWLYTQSINNPDSIAIISKTEKISYKEYYRYAVQYCCSLTESGIKNKDRVGVLLNNSKEFLFIINALWFCGAVPVVLNTRLTENELTQQIENIKLSYLIAEETRFSKNFVEVISLSYLKSKSQINQKCIQDFDLKNDALIMFTSGSTGKSKAVVHTFENIYESVFSLNSFINLNDNDRWLASLPFYHIGGFMILCRSLISGSTLIIPSSIKHEELKYFIEKFEPTHISFVSTTLKKLINERFKANKNIKYVFLGGGPVEASLCKQAIKEGWNIIKVYGSTETCSMIAALSSKDFILKPDSAGKPLSNVNIEIVDSTGSFLKHNQKGEIAVKSKTLFKEYLFSTETKREIDGFFLTGDYGWIDEDGYLYVESRKDDIIITGGENVSAREVEDALNNLDEVEDAYVFPENDEIWGQSISAAVVIKYKIDIDGIKTKLGSLIANYKIPKNFYFVSEIPRTELDKVDKEKLNSIIKAIDGAIH